MAQEIFGGMSVDEALAGFNGRFELSDEDYRELDLDHAFQFVVQVRVVGDGKQLVKGGDRRRVVTLKVEDARLATGEIEAVAREWLDEKQGPTLFTQTAPPNVTANGELQVADESQFEAIEVVSAPRQTQPRVQLATDGPKVAKFSEFSTNGTVDEVEVVGALYGHNRKDSRLVKFMEGDE